MAKKLTVFTPCGIVYFYTDQDGDVEHIESTHKEAEQYIQMVFQTGQARKESGHAISYPPTERDLERWLNGNFGLTVIDDTETVSDDTE